MDHRLKAALRFTAPFIVLGLALVSVETATAAWVMEYRGLLSPNHHGVGFQRPQSLSLSPNDGELCVTDEGSGELRIFSDKGVFTFGTGSLSELSHPASAALDPFGGFYLTDAKEGVGRTLRRLNYRGEPMAYTPESPVEGWSPDQLFIARDGGIVSLDGKTALLTKHDPASGALIWQRRIGDESAGENLVFGRPAESADGRIYLPCASLHMVFVRDAEGRPLGSFGEFGATRGGLIFPVGVDFGPEGTILLLDRIRHTVLLFDENHAFLAEYGSFGGREGQFYHPVALAARADGRVYVAQGYGSRVQVFQLLSTGADGAEESSNTITRTTIANCGPWPEEVVAFAAGPAAFMHL